MGLGQVRSLVFCPTTSTDLTLAFRCHEVGWFQDSPPDGHPALVSRLVQPTSDERQCTYFFPEAFANGTFPEPTVDAINQAYDGWFVQVDHLFFANGRREYYNALA